MNAKSQYLIQVLEKIGLPLLSSIVEVSAGAPDNPVAEDAQRMAELLARTTQASLEISSVISPINATQNDAFRLALAALAAPVIADHYRYDRQVPGDADIKKITAALQTVVTFADNFEAELDNAKALQGLEGAADSTQTALHQIMAFTPVINEVSSFSFGMNEPKLISDIVLRLVEKSLSMSAQWFSGEDEPARKKNALDILKCLARIYASCHMAETARLQTAGASDGGLETVWKNFDLRAALLEALASSLLGSSTSASSASRAPEPETVAAPPTHSGGATNPLSGFAKKPAMETPPAPESSGGASPLGMFAKKPAGDTPPPPPSQAPEKPQGQPGNPMGFFKPPAKKDDE
ncbi:MAG: hypothetical protein ACT4OY_03920 [Alphaproteobacteria bacterium]